jgi:hypothetical protein
VNLASDNANCGACDHACPSGLSCTNGACTCNGQICSMSDTCCASGCANLMSSTSNCGACGHACAANETCSAGTCKCGTTTCGAGETCCGGTCKSLDGDSMNCGACGKACNAGEQCMAGACVCAGTDPPRGCAPNEACCGAAGPALGGCFDLSSDQSHCGSCSIGCSMSQQCIMGMCKQTGCNPPCTNGNSCNPMTLRCECGSGSAACADPQFCCSGACVNRLTDTHNCGQCGNDVKPNLCCNGQSTPNDEQNCGQCGKQCNADQFCCGSQNTAGRNCVNNDEQNCGGCGVTCPPPSAPLSKTCCTCGRMGVCQIACTNICAGGGM